MTADTVVCLEPAALAPSICRRPDAVPSRVAYHHPITNYERFQAEANHEPQPGAAKRLGFLGSRPGGPHPGDVAYWVACLGGACLLVLCATH